MLPSFFSDPTSAILSLIAVIVALTIHEWAHAYAAYKLGDRTAYASGRLTLNPLAHIDSLGLISLVLLGFGWGRPVPIDTMDLRRGKLGLTIVSLAGIASNFALALGLLALIKIVGLFSPDIFLLRADNLGSLLYWRIILINLFLGLFNLIPIPPLDGSKVLMSWLNLSPITMYNFERYGPFILIGVIILDSVTGLNLLSNLLQTVVFSLFQLFQL